MAEQVHPANRVIIVLSSKEAATLILAATSYLSPSSMVKLA